MFITSGRAMSVTEAAREGRNRGVDVAILDCIKRWARDYPNELIALDQKVKLERQTLLNNKGISAEKRQLHKAEIPTTLYHRMRSEIDKGWLDIPDLRNRFYRIFRVGLINPKSEMNR